jgi:D-glycero-beta-D-manno-heptose 1-phosphate adenylyltransferase
MSSGFSIKNKIFTADRLLYQANSRKITGLKVGFTNGCFDILHKGHVTYLEEAKRHCDLLIVGVNSDASVKQLNKGNNRPVNDENARAFVLAALVSVDCVTIFNDPTPLSLIEKIKPDFLFKGGDYDANEKDPKNKKYIVGSDIVKANGGKVITIPLVEGYSTTSILEKSANH